MNAYKLTEKPNWSLGRAGLLITSGGGMVEVAFHGVQYRQLAQRVCDEMNGVKVTAVEAGGCAPPVHVVEPSDQVREAVKDAVAEALGDALDCTRSWSAWGVGTMGPDDFELVREDGERVAEIADAAIAAMGKAVSHG